MSKTLRIIFAGTDFGKARHLDALLSSGHQLACLPNRIARQAVVKVNAQPAKVLAEEHVTRLPARILTT